VGGVAFLTTLAVEFFCPTPNVQLDHFSHHTLKFEIPVEMVQFLLKLLLKHISCCAPRFPFILTAKLHSLYVKESESGILERSESEILKSLSGKFWKGWIQWSKTRERPSISPFSKFA